MEPLENCSKREAACTPILECQICHNQNLEEVVSLGHQAPVHAHLTPKALNSQEVFYPLNLQRCGECGLLQLGHVVDPHILFPPEYPYFTGLTNMLVNNFRTLAEILITRQSLDPGDLVVDIGSNDGTLLQGFKDKGMRVLGIEPTAVAEVARQKGIPTIRGFFADELVPRILEKEGPAKLVTATNVFAHINNLQALLKNIKTLLDEKGLFVSESQYLLDMVEKSALDTIYHEHLRYYSLLPLMKLFDHFGMSVVDAERIPAAGGSIRVYAAKGKQPTSERALKIVENEKEEGLYDEELYKKWAGNLLQVRHRLQKLLLDIRLQGGRIAGIGAPGRSNTLLQFMKLDSGMIEYACEKKGSPKIGLLTPGTHIPIVDEEVLFRKQPEFGFLLSWHIGEELMKKFRQLGFRGRFIVPLPEPKVIH